MTDVTLGIDVSTYQAGLDASRMVHAQFVAARCTRGRTYVDPTYAENRRQAAEDQRLFTPYHFLYAGTGGTQAAWAARNVGDASLPITIDVEHSSAGGNPSMDDLTAFVNTWMAAGGKPGLIYLPHWYWEGTLGSPDLTWFMSTGWRLWASEYPLGNTQGSLTSLWSKIDPAKHFKPYGGAKPTIWQFASTAVAPGFTANTVDADAFLGTRSDLAALGCFYDYTLKKPTPPVESKKTRHLIAEEIVKLAADGIKANVKHPDRASDFKEILDIASDLAIPS